jgi:predicted flavoprotein YhiN
MRIRNENKQCCDVLVVGAGAAGLFAALAARGVLQADGTLREPAADAPHVVLLNNEARLGLKILASGGGRCNLTNAQVDAADYESDTPRVVRGLLRGLPPQAVRAFFESRGCSSYEEPLGKVFPKSNKARDVLDTLLGAVNSAGIDLVAPVEVTDLTPPDVGGQLWGVHTKKGPEWQARTVIVAAGGKSLPKTGSRGFGLTELQRLGHTIAAPVPALTPLLLSGKGPLSGLAGLTVPAVLSLPPAACWSPTRAPRGRHPSTSAVPAQEQDWQVTTWCCMPISGASLPTKVPGQTFAAWTNHLALPCHRHWLHARLPERHSTVRHRICSASVTAR